MIFNLVEIVILALINTFSVFLVIVILANVIHQKLYKWFVLMTFSLVGWIDFAYMGYWEPNSTLAIISYRINWAFVAAFFSLAYIFYIESFESVQKFV